MNTRSMQSSRAAPCFNEAHIALYVAGGLSEDLSVKIALAAECDLELAAKVSLMRQLLSDRHASDAVSVENSAGSLSFVRNSSQGDTANTVGTVERLVTSIGGTMFAGNSECVSAVPEQIGRYTIQSILGEGGFGRVYLANDPVLGREVAIKVPLRPPFISGIDREAYLREARLLACLDHPGIVRVYDFQATNDGSCFVVSAFVRGMSLATRIEKGRLSYAEAADLAAQIADALHHAHMHKIVHRDIKPSNILIDGQRRAHVADFGLACNAVTLTASWQFAGTPAYMSPEQAHREGHRIDGRSDIFSLGVVLYELLAGRRPFIGSDKEMLLEQIRHGDPCPPRQIDRGVPNALEDICLKALAKRPTDRYRTATEMACDLRSWLMQNSGRSDRWIRWRHRVSARNARRAPEGLPTIAAEVESLNANAFQSVPTQPSIVTVAGTQVLVQERLQDGSLGIANALVVRGVDWSPNSVGGTELPSQEFAKWYQTDIPLMQKMGVNVVRLYHDFGTGPAAFQILDAFYQAGIKVIVTVDSPQYGVDGDMNNISTVVNAYKNHPAVLMWNVGNEWDLDGYRNQYSTLTAAAQFTHQAAQVVKSLDSNHPVTTAIADPDFPFNVNGFIHPLTENPSLPGNLTEPNTAALVNALVPSIDVWSSQVYRGASFQDVFQQWASISTKPLLISEFGADAYDQRANAENQSMQSQFNTSLWNELQFNLWAAQSPGVPVGGLAFELHDEWKNIANPSPSVSDIVHETNSGGVDGYLDEEWFGMTNTNGVPRPACSTLASRFVLGASAVVWDAKPTIQVTSQLGGSTTVQFQIDGKIVLSRAGIAGSRGINVAVLDPNTGIRMSADHSFDTWFSFGGFGGPHVNFPPLINYLNSLPNGAIVALSISDDAGFINPVTGEPWPEPNVEQAYQALESLGSTQIRGVGYRGGWAMIAAKGQGMLAESSSKYAAGYVPATASAQVPPARNPGETKLAFLAE